jgi:hypothetical protein
VSCADPRTHTASAACCNDGSYTGSWNDMVRHIAVYCIVCTDDTTC